MKKTDQQKIERLREPSVFGPAELAISILAFGFVLSTTILINILF
jgi:hypothetical protein